jgi:hypothetical protein
MKKIKIYLALSFWAILCLFLFYQYHLDSLVKIEEEKAISITNQKIRNLTQKLHNSKLERAEIHINEYGNDKRDRDVYNKINDAYFSVEQLYEKDKIDSKNIKSVLTDSASIHFTTKTINPSTNDSKILKSIYNINLYQNAYNLLSEEYSKLYGFGGGFGKVMVFNASDTTLGLFSTKSFFNFAEISKINTKILNAKYTVDIEGGLAFSKDFKEPIIFQVNINTKTDSIEKRYRITTPKGQKIKPFDYQEIE